MNSFMILSISGILSFASFVIGRVNGCDDRDDVMMMMTRNGLWDYLINSIWTTFDRNGNQNFATNKHYNDGSHSNNNNIRMQQHQNAQHQASEKISGWSGITPFIGGVCFELRTYAISDSSVFVVRNMKHECASIMHNWVNRLLWKRLHMKM